MILPHPPRAAEAARREAPGHASRETPRAGGIAQLVERQLCKLDAAGSSPAASTIPFPGGGAGPAPRKRACSSVG